MILLSSLWIVECRGGKLCSHLTPAGPGSMTMFAEPILASSAEERLRDGGGYGGGPPQHYPHHHHDPAPGPAHGDKGHYYPDSDGDREVGRGAGSASRSSCYSE